MTSNPQLLLDLQQRRPLPFRGRFEEPVGGHFHGERGDPGRAGRGAALPARPHLQDHPHVPGNEAHRRRNQVWVIQWTSAVHK